mmetsp:Transcript_60424/g.159758  ORF Transcript_60424/g.159758 Transcript_60424/m.159758 type:complete len:273 (+) Transcript_60424:2588-3406(+)
MRLVNAASACWYDRKRWKACGGSGGRSHGATCSRSAPTETHLPDARTTSFEASSSESALCSNHSSASGGESSSAQCRLGKCCDSADWTSSRKRAWSGKRLPAACAPPALSCTSIALLCRLSVSTSVCFERRISIDWRLSLGSWRPLIVRCAHTMSVAHRWSYAPSGRKPSFRSCASPSNSNPRAPCAVSEKCRRQRGASSGASNTSVPRSSAGTMRSSDPRSGTASPALTTSSVSCCQNGAKRSSAQTTFCSRSGVARALLWSTSAAHSSSR